MSDSYLIRKALTILNESVLEDGENWKRTKAQQDFDKEFDDVPRDEDEDDEDSDAYDKHKDADEEDLEEEDDSVEAPAKAEKDSAPKASKAPKSSNKSKVDWASHSFPGMGEGIYEGEELEEGVNITLDGPEADEFVARLMQLSGQPAPMPAQPDAAPVEPMSLNTLPVPADMDGAPAMGMDEPAGIPIDQPVVDADHYVCDDCHCAPCECDTMGDIALENADHDYGHEELEATGEEVDPDTYMWKAVTPPQRLVKGTLGDNPMIAQESMDRYNRIVDDYVKYLNESDNMGNEDGVASPLTASDRQEFEKDPFAGEQPTDDGSMSPMSQVKRQDLPK